MVRVASTLIIAIILSSCASHPRVGSQRMAEGDVEYGYAFSVENVLPYLWYRKGISKRSDIGVRVGLPIYGSGLDYSRLLYEKDNKWDMLNLAWSLNPNYNFDFTYYKFRQRKNKKTGELAWEDASPGQNILHGQWANPAYAVIEGKPQVVFPGGDGVVYSLEPETGELIWKFDCNPKESVWELGGRGTRNSIIATPVVYNDRVFIAVGQDPEHGEGVGHLWAIDATQTGDVTESAGVWHFGNKDYSRTMSTVAIQNGLLFTADLSGFVYCLDAETGQHHWTYDTFAAIWASTFVADGKVYIGDEDGDLAVLELSLIHI